MPTVNFNGTFTTGPNGILTPVAPTNKISEYPVPVGFTLHAPPTNVPIAIGIPAGLFAALVVCIAALLLQRHKHKKIKRTFQEWHRIHQGAEYDEREFGILAPLWRLLGKIRSTPPPLVITDPPSRRVFLRGGFVPFPTQAGGVPAIDPRETRRCDVICAVSFPTQIAGLASGSGSIPSLILHLYDTGTSKEEGPRAITFDYYCIGESPGNSPSGSALQFGGSHGGFISSVFQNDGIHPLAATSDSNSPALQQQQGGGRSRWYILLPEGLNQATTGLTNNNVTESSVMSAKERNAWLDSIVRRLADGPMRFVLSIVAVDPRRQASLWNGQTRVGTVVLSGIFSASDTQWGHLTRRLN